MAKSNNIKNSLSYFAKRTAGPEDAFSDPYEDDTSSYMLTPSIADKIIEEESVSKKSKKKKQKPKDKFERLIEKGEALKSKFEDDDMIISFDEYVAYGFMDDEDVELRNTLVSMGRKYARETKSTGEQSEISKAYAGAENSLNSLYDEINKDKEMLQKDINVLRSSTHNTNRKLLAELVESKAQYHSTALSVIKEINAMTKAKFDLQMKVKAKEDDESGATVAASKALQSVFSLNRKDLMSSIGGYGEVSGGAYDEEVDDYSAFADEAIQQKYFNTDEKESDGDKFIKYEGRGVRYILLYDPETGDKDIIAEDRDGVIIPDYPMPTNSVSDLTFDISESTMSATDNYHRRYDLRYM